jgi:hypothetical protein
LTVWYLTGKKNILHWGKEFKRMSEAVRLHEAEDRVSVSFPENIEGNEKALEKLGGMEYIGARRIVN